MSKKSLIVILLCALAFVPASAQTTTASGVFDYDMAKTLVRGLNQVRMKRDIRTFKMERDLTEAAMLRAAEISTQWHSVEEWPAAIEDHTRPDGKSFFSSISEKYSLPTSMRCCELCFRSWNCPLMREKITSYFLKDENANLHILGKWEAVGAGVFHSDARTFIVLLFLSKGNGIGEVPSGKWNATVQVGLSVNKKTTILKKEPAAPDYPSGVSTELSGSYYYDFAAKVVELVNEERRKAGVPPIAMDSVLTEGSMLRAAETVIPTSGVSYSYMTGIGDKNGFSVSNSDKKGFYYMTHVRPNKYASETIFNLAPGSYGENIALGQKTPEIVVEDWMGSPGHRSNILNKSYRRIGVGCFFEDGVFYWTQTFSGEAANGDYSPSHHEEVTVQVSLSPDTETKVVTRKKVE